MDKLEKFNIVYKITVVLCGVALGYLLAVM